MIRSFPQIAVSAAFLALATACSPALDWREFTIEGTDLRVTFPCRPDVQSRSMTLAQARLHLEMHACSADGTTFAVAFADVADPALIGPVLASLREAAVLNIKGASPQLSAFSLSNMTPSDQAGRLSVAGQLPDGASVHEQVAFFARGMRIYQASVIGTDPGRELVDTFFGGLKFSG